ncbi:TonB-dependent siderophore receptor [Arcobacter lacus]|uniref:TonB-dependent siderophore receptor n=1 Tax=Arcobacter lacus TaxID=1912876 RepID=UPI0021BB13E1|nr:TonB-dependent siderophore receptor [Arcobacter lacus]MCT7910525.1 TonB-dependent siderophore receptor [Arcobacter lacus]
MKRKSILVAPVLAILLNTSLSAEQFSVSNLTLKQAIEEISKKSNMPYMVDGKLLDGKKAPNIKNIEGVENALNEILKGTNLKAVIEDGTILIKEKAVGQGTVLEPISVNEGYSNGSAENGYLVEETSNIGVWRGKSLQDTPYSINVMSEELLKNLQATTIDQIYLTNPTIQLVEPQSTWGAATPMLRGFGLETTVFNGIKREKWQYDLSSNPEEYERVETITGLSGFLYGGGNIGGVINYIPKRPTATAQRSVTVGNAGGSGYYAHADLGGSIDEEKKFGYRLNILSQDGGTFVDNQNLERNLASLALDWHISDSVLVQLLASRGEHKLEGVQPYWFLATGATRPSASSIDNTKLWGQKWAIVDTETTKYNANLEWNISDNINFRTAALKEITERTQMRSSNTIQTDGTYEQTTNDSGASYDEINGYGGYAFFDFDFNTFGVKHELTTGVQISDSYYDIYLNTPITATLTSLSLDSPTYISKPTGGNSTGVVFNKLLHSHSTNYSIGDSIEFNSYWSMLVGLSQVNIEYRDSGYKESAVTPSVSLVYKPIENLSLYTSYMEGFEQGGVAGDSYGGYVVVNAKTVMDPLASEQIEVGAKLTLGDTLLTVALFDIDKGLEYYDLSDVTKPKYVQDGRQVHRGFEFTATGKITDKLTTMAGFTLLDPQVKENKENPTLEGKQPINVADKFAKLYLEYFPFNDMDLAFNTGLNYTGSFYGDAMNTDKMPSYTLVNIGTRYTTKEMGYPLTFRVNINNLMDKEYWVNSNYLGDRRTIHASVQMKF